MVSWWFKSLAGKKKSTNLVVLNASGWPWSMHNAENIESVHSQEDRSHSHCSARKIACKAHISRSFVHNIIKEDLQIGLNFMF